MRFSLRGHEPCHATLILKPPAYFLGSLPSQTTPSISFEVRKSDFGNWRLGRGCRFLVDVDAVDLLRDGEVIGLLFEQAPAPVLRHEPHAVGQVRVVHRALVGKFHVVRLVPFFADAVVVAAEHTGEDHIGIGVHVRLVGDGLRGFLAVRQRRVDPAPGIEYRRGHRARGVRVFSDEFRGGAQRLLGMIFPDRLRGLDREADAVDDRAVAPRLADAEPVHVADAHVGDHLRRRHRDDLGVGERIDAVRCEPVINPHRVRAGRERLRERVFALFLVHQHLQRRAVLDAFVVEFFRERDRLAVVVEVHQDRHVLLRAADTHLHAVDEPVEHVRRVEFAVDELVAHRGP